MAANYTANYNLCQWEATDQVLRTDFNQDNAKLEAALSSLEERVAELYRAVPNLAFYIGQLGILDVMDRKRYLNQLSMIYEAFQHPDSLSCTGGVAIQSGVLVLSGQNAVGTMTSANLSLTESDWTTARMWLHHDRGTVTPFLNGTAMTQVRGFRGGAMNGADCWCREYVGYGPKTDSAQISLELSCGNVSSMSVYDYCVLFF